MNYEMIRVLNYRVANKLSVVMKKANFMLITSPRKKVTSISILNSDGRTCIKYQHLSWKDQIVQVKNKLAKNIGILFKFRYYVDLKMPN